MLRLQRRAKSEGHQSGADGRGSEPLSFKDVCGGAGPVTASNCLARLWRCTGNLTKEGYLYWATLAQPTNFVMLTFRTFNIDFDEPHHNKDHLAARLRDALMPARSKLHHQKSSLAILKKKLLQTPYFGIPGIYNFVDARTQWFDEGVQQALDDGINQVVIIAAGFDTRAYRMGRPGVCFFELDVPSASRMKQQLAQDLMPEYTAPEYIAADLSKVSLCDALAGSSFHPNCKTLFMFEGLSYYLRSSDLKQLLTSISQNAAPGSLLQFDFLHLSTLQGDAWHPGFETLSLAVWNKGEPMHTGIDERPHAVQALLALFGFSLTELLTAQDMTYRYLPHLQRDWTNHPLHPPIAPYFGYVSARKVGLQGQAPAGDAGSSTAVATGSKL